MKNKRNNMKKKPFEGIKVADFVVENFAGGVMTEMGLGHEGLKKNR